TVSVTSTVAFIAVVKATFPEATKALISAIVPVKVTALAVPPTVTSEPETAESEPLGTENVAVTAAAPASTSLKLIPVSGVCTSSTTAIVAGAVVIGASLTATTVTVETMDKALVSTPPLAGQPPTCRAVSLNTRGEGVGVAPK